jgi:hypothetical protein
MPPGRGASGGAKSGSTGRGSSTGGTKGPVGGKTSKDTATATDTIENEGFTPGQNGTLTWNTTQEIDRRPILLYVFNGHETTGAGYALSRLLELEVMKDKEVVLTAEDFVCEKTCLKEGDFLQVLKGREPVQAWLAANMTKADQRRTQLVVLDANGGVLRAFDEKELRRGGATLVLRELKKAAKENVARVTPRAPKKV